jgi:hypothetical protein
MAPVQISLYKLIPKYLLLLFDPAEWFDKGIDDHLLAGHLLVFLAFERLSDGENECASGIFAKNYLLFLLAFRAKVRKLEFLFLNYGFEDQ